MGTDFFDDDLVDDRGQGGLPLDKRGVIPMGSISDAELNRLVQQKEERSHRVVGAIEEIERLRMRQMELEREKSDLESLTKRQNEYESAKRDIVSKLEKSIVLLDKQAAEAARVGDLVETVRGRFQETLKDVTGIIEESWPADRFEHELNKASVRIDEAQSLYRKGLSKVSATNWFRGGTDEPVGAAPGQGTTTHRPGRVGYWLMAGFAFAFPLILAVIGCFVAWLFLTGIL